jgi:DUF971 family protein
MRFVTFQGYGVGAREVTVVAERVTHLHLIDFNGNYGTEIYLDTGQTVRVCEWPKDVEKKLAEPA